MKFVANAALVSLGLVFSTPSSLLAQESDPARMSVCSLLPKQEVKKHLPWNPILDQMPIEDEPVGASGSACNYPTVYIQVLPFSQGTINFLREKGGLEVVDDLGDEAYFHNNENGYAEVYVKVGEHLLTLQANADDGIEAVKPNVLKLAAALVAELR